MILNIGYGVEVVVVEKVVAVVCPAISARCGHVIPRVHLGALLVDRTIKSRKKRQTEVALWDHWRLHRLFEGGCIACSKVKTVKASGGDGGTPGRAARVVFNVTLPMTPFRPGSIRWSSRITRPSRTSFRAASIFAGVM